MSLLTCNCITNSNSLLTLIKSFDTSYFLIYPDTSKWFRFLYVTSKYAWLVIWDPETFVLLEPGNFFYCYNIILRYIFYIKAGVHYNPQIVGHRCPGNNSNKNLQCFWLKFIEEASVCNFVDVCRTMFRQGDNWRHSRKRWGSILICRYYV